MPLFRPAIRRPSSIEPLRFFPRARVGLAALLLLALPLAASAAGTFVDPASGKRILWGSLPVTWNLDRGPLGDLSESEAQTLIRAAIQGWNDVDTSRMQLQEGVRLRKDFSWQDANGYDNNLGQFLQDEFLSRGQNPVLLDNDGLMTDILLGSGARFDIIGFAGPFWNSNDVAFFAFALLNGRWLKASAGDQQFTPEEYQAIVAHEMGHFISLDHSQINNHLANNGFPDDDAYVPVMFPTSSDDETLRATPGFDDRVSVSDAYAPRDGSFDANFGVITGRAVFGDGADAPGANVVARKTDDREGTVVTSVTGRLGDFSGDFRIPGLPPGEYEIAVEPLQTLFISGSSVGPYSEFEDDISFSSPVQPEYYSGEPGGGESGDRSQATVVQVVAGQETEIEIRVQDLDLVAERSAHLLALGAPERGGSRGRGFGQTNQYAVVVNDAVETLTITAAPEGDGELQIAINRDDAASPGNFTDLARAGVGETVGITLRRGQTSSTGDGPPLEDGTYFIDVVSFDASPGAFTITAGTQAGPEPTPTPIPDTPIGVGQQVLDLFQIGASWQQEIADPGTGVDFDGSGRVGREDLYMLLDDQAR